MLEIKSDEFMLELRWNAIKAVGACRLGASRVSPGSDGLALGTGERDGNGCAGRCDGPRGRHRRLAFFVHRSNSELRSENIQCGPISRVYRVFESFEDNAARE